MVAIAFDRSPVLLQLDEAPTARSWSSVCTRVSKSLPVGGRTKIVYAFVATLEPSTAFTVNVNAPGCVGTPLITPPVIESPGGSLPLTMLHVGTPLYESVAR